MFPFRNILFPTDFSPSAQAALKYAAAFARHGGGRVLLFSVQDAKTAADRDFPVSLGKIRDALERAAASGFLLKNVQDTPLFRIEIRERQKIEELLETAMKPELYEKVKQPTLMLYYYRDKIHQDSVVKVEAMQKMYEELGTPEDKKRSVAVPKAGNHVIGSYIKSQDVATVEKEIEKFMDNVLRLK